MAKDEKTTVCIVGKSPNIIGKGLGSLIDSHDIVVRINTNGQPPIKEDYGTKTNHIHTHPYIGMRYNLEGEQHRLLLDALKNLTHPTHDENSRKTLYVVLQDESWWTYPDNGCLSGIEGEVFSVHDKKKNFEELKKICGREHFGAALEVRYFEPEARNVAGLMIRFNPSQKYLSHGLLTGTETILYYANRFKNVSITGFTTDYEDPVLNNIHAILLLQMEYDVFILKQLLKLGLIKRMTAIKLKRKLSE